CPRADPIEPPPGEHLTAAVRDAERDHDPREVGVGPAELGLEMRRQHAERLAIDVIHDRRQKQQRSNAPTQSAGGDSWTHMRPARWSPVRSDADPAWRNSVVSSCDRRIDAGAIGDTSPSTHILTAAALRD